MARVPAWLRVETKPITLKVVKPETRIFVRREELKERAGDILWEVKGILSELEDIERSLDEIRKRLEIIRKRAKYLVERL